jgi:hypothetical protein
MTHRLVDLVVTEISLCRHGLNPAARILLVKGGDAPPDPVAAAVAKAVADREAEIAVLKAERARGQRLAKAAAWGVLGIAPDAYADHAAAMEGPALAWLDGVFDRAAAALAEADLWGERGRAAVPHPEAAIVRRARAARGPA